MSSIGQVTNIDTNNASASSGLAAVPNIAQIQSIIMTSASGKEEDIRFITQKIEITESIYSPTLILNLTIQESAAFFERFPIIGQELITIIFNKADFKDGPTPIKEVIHTFKVTEYNNYNRSDEQEKVANYTLSAISAFAYNSASLTVSRSYGRKRDITEEIQNLFSELGVDELNVIGEVNTKSVGILNKQDPLKAIEFLRKHCFDANGGPFYIFQTLDSKVNMVSYENLVKKVPYEKYHATKIFSHNAYSTEDYEDRKKRILRVNSFMDLSKFFSGQEGAYASKTNTMDWSNKSYITSQFTYNQSATLNDNKPFSSETDDPSNKFDTKSNNMSVNAMAWEGASGYNDELNKNVSEMQSHQANLDTMTHDVQLMGDFDLNAGQVISLVFPRNVDPQSMDIYGLDESLEDKHLSGKFLITSCTHVFDVNDYRCDIIAKRDSFSISV